MRKIITIAAASLMIAGTFPAYANNDDDARARCGRMSCGQLAESRSIDRLGERHDRDHSRHSSHDTDDRGGRDGHDDDHGGDDDDDRGGHDRDHD